MLIQSRTISDIAHDIYEEIVMGRWTRKAAASALPYIRAMHQLEKVTDTYGADKADTIILYFLSNATTWRGPTARRIKAELKELLK